MQRFIETGGDDILCNADLMRRDADMADLALRLCLEHGLVHAGAVAGAVALTGHVELVDIDVVALQQAQGRFQIGPEVLGRLGGGLRGDIQAVPVPAEGKTELFLAVRIGAGRVEEAHAALAGAAEQADGLVRAHALDGKCAEGVLRNGDAGCAECDLFHIGSSLSGFDFGSRARSGLSCPAAWRASSRRRRRTAAISPFVRSSSRSSSAAETRSTPLRRAESWMSASDVATRTA